MYFTDWKGLSLDIVSCFSLLYTNEFSIIHWLGQLVIFSLKRNKSHHMHTQRDRHICGLEFIGCYIPLNAVQTSKGNQMLSKENQIPHYTARVRALKRLVLIFLLGLFPSIMLLGRTKNCLQDCSKILQFASSDSILQVGRLVLSFPCHVSNSSCSSQGRPVPMVWEQTLQKPLFLPTTGIPTGPHGIRVTTNCWTTEQRTLLGHRQLNEEVLCHNFKLQQLLSDDFCLHLCRKQIHFMCWSTDIVWHVRLSVHSFFESCSHKWGKKKKQSHLPKESTLQS